MRVSQVLEVLPHTLAPIKKSPIYKNIVDMWSGITMSNYLNALKVCSYLRGVENVCKARGYTAEEKAVSKLRHKAKGIATKLLTGDG